MSTDSGPEKRPAKRKMAVGLLSILLLLAVGVSGFLYLQYQRALKNNPDRELQRIVAEIDDTILLPTEKPALSTILDKTKLTNWSLKQRAQNGDKILLYAQAKRLIIFRPSSGKVVDMLTIQDKTSSSEKDPSKSTAPAP